MNWHNTGYHPLDSTNENKHFLSYLVSIVTVDVEISIIIIDIVVAVNVIVIVIIVDVIVDVEDERHDVGQEADVGHGVAAAEHRARPVASAGSRGGLAAEQRRGRLLALRSRPRGEGRARRLVLGEGTRLVRFSFFLWRV